MASAENPYRTATFEAQAPYQEDFVDDELQEAMQEAENAESEANEQDGVGSPHHRSSKAGPWCNSSLFQTALSLSLVPAVDDSSSSGPALEDSSHSAKQPSSFPTASFPSAIVFISRVVQITGLHITCPFKDTTFNDSCAR